MSSSRRLLCLLACAGCNSLYGLEPTKLEPLDAPYYDAPPDAPFACPPIGTTPRFDALLHQPILEACSDYTIGGGHAIGDCQPAVGGFGEGAIDMPLTLASGLIAPSPFVATQPRQGPEGDELFVSYVFSRSTPGEIHAYHRDSPNAWSHAYQLQTAAALQPTLRLGTPSAGPTRRMFILDGGMLEELEVDATGVATVHDSYTAADLGLSYFANAPSLTPDGLRLVVAGVATGDIWQRVVYSDRPNLASRFRPADVVPGLAFVNDPFLTADCGRIYFSAVTSVLFIQRD